MLHQSGKALARPGHGSTQWAVHYYGPSQLPQSQSMHVNSNSWENAGTNPNFWSCLQL